MAPSTYRQNAWIKKSALYLLPWAICTDFLPNIYIYFFRKFNTFRRVSLDHIKQFPSLTCKTSRSLCVTFGERGRHSFYGHHFVPSRVASGYYFLFFILFPLITLVRMITLWWDEALRDRGQSKMSFYWVKTTFNCTQMTFCGGVMTLHCVRSSLTTLCWWPQFDSRICRSPRLF